MTLPVKKVGAIRMDKHRLAEELRARQRLTQAENEERVWSY